MQIPAYRRAQARSEYRNTALNSPHPAVTAILQATPKNPRFHPPKWAQARACRDLHHPPQEGHVCFKAVFFEALGF